MMKINIIGMNTIIWFKNDNLENCFSHGIEKIINKELNKFNLPTHNS